MSEWVIRDTLAAADARDISAFLGHLTEDVSFRFANAPAVRGHVEVAHALETFFEHVVRMRHIVQGMHHCGNVWAVETTAEYGDRFGRAFAFPACNLLTFRGIRISDYRIFVDNNAMFIPPTHPVAAGGESPS